MVVNTNDPDYEHIYSIESYNDDVDDLLYIAPSGSNSNGAVFPPVSGMPAVSDIPFFTLYPGSAVYADCVFFLFLFFCLCFDRRDSSRNRRNRQF